jgi:hypothetical protein
VISVIEPSGGCGCDEPVSNCECGEPLPVVQSQQSIIGCGCGDPFPAVQSQPSSTGCGCDQPVSTCDCGDPLPAVQNQPSLIGCGCDQAVLPWDLAVSIDESAACACEPVVFTGEPVVFTGEPPVTCCGSDQPKSTCGCNQTSVRIDLEPPVSTCGCGQSEPVVAESQTGAKTTSERIFDFLKEMYSIGKHLLVMFVGFAFIGYFLNGLIPASWVTALFGSGNVYSVLLAATLGLPFYINSEASLPLIRSLMDAGMSQGAGLAFMIAGAGTSIGAMAGALTIARWRVVALVVGVLWVGAIASGYAYDLFLSLQLI